ncbi:hypothetical protein JCM9803A_01560 [Rhodococcus erythropolis]
MHYAVMIAVFIAVACQHDLASFAWINLGTQAFLFTAFACIPAYRTSKMSFVDAAWPLGLVALGVQTLIFGDLHSSLTITVAGIYLFMGARMAWWACGFVYSGKSFNELPRYRYQRIRWNKAGLRSEQLSIQVEILLQGCANATILALPALLVASYSANPFGIAALVGVVLWVLAYVFESLADAQKARFGRMNARQGVRGRTCDIGLWRYSRHPNYFGQWMQWNALIVMVIPILIDRWDDTSLWAWVLVVAGILAASASMYYTLVVFTGAEPSEYYSLQSRPDYAEYQRTTNKFFPGPTHVAELTRPVAGI